MQFATGGNGPKAEAWVQGHASKFDVKYRKVRHGGFFIIGGKPDAIARFLNASKQVGIVATTLTKMSRLRHVCVFAMQVTSKVRDMWCGTTSAVKN